MQDAEKQRLALAVQLHVSRQKLHQAQANPQQHHACAHHHHHGPDASESAEELADRMADLRQAFRRHGQAAAEHCRDLRAELDDDDDDAQGHDE